MNYKQKARELKTEWKKWLPITLVVLVFLIIYISLTSVHTLTLWDENVYLSNARGHLVENHFEEDFRFPLLEYVLAVWWSFTGISLFSARMLAILFSLASVVAVYLISKHLFEKRWQSLVASILFASTSQMIFWSFRVYNDIPALATALFSIYCLLQARANPEKKKTYLIWFGILSAATLLFRFPVILIPIIGAIWWLLTTKNNQFKDATLMACSGFVGLLPWFVFNTIQYRNPIWDLVAQAKAVGAYTTWQANSILAQFIQSTFGIGLIFLFPAIVRTFHKKDSKILLIWSLLLIQGIFYFSIVRLKLERYVLMFSPFIVILSIYGIDEINDVIKTYIQKWKTIRKRRTRIAKGIQQSILVIMLILLIMPILIGSTETTLQVKNEKHQHRAFFFAIDEVDQLTESGDVVNSNYWPWFGYYANVKARFLWTENVTHLIEEDNTKIIIVREFPFEKHINVTTILEQNTTELVTRINGTSETIYIIKTV